MKKVDTQKKGYSVGKAAVGGLLLGPVGLIGGAFGKKSQHIIAESVDLTMNIMDKQETCKATFKIALYH